MQTDQDLSKFLNVTIGTDGKNSEVILIEGLPESLQKTNHWTGPTPGTRVLETGIETKVFFSVVENVLLIFFVVGEKSRSGDASVSDGFDVDVDADVDDFAAVTTDQLNSRRLKRALQQMQNVFFSSSVLASQSLSPLDRPNSTPGLTTTTNTRFDFLSTHFFKRHIQFTGWIKL